MKHKKRLMAFVCSAIMAITLFGGCITSFAEVRKPIIEHVRASVSQEKCEVFVSGLTDGKEYYVNIKKGDDVIGTTDPFITKNGWAEVTLEELLASQTMYTADLYEHTASTPVSLCTLQFDVDGEIIEHIRALVSHTECEVFVNGLKEGTDYIVVVEKDGEKLGESDKFDNTHKGVVPVSLNVALAKGELYTSKLYDCTDDDPLILLYELPFDVDGEMIEHVEAYVSKKEATVVVSGLKEGHEYFVNIEKDGEYIGTTDPFITKNGEAVVTLFEPLEKDVVYTAKLYDGTTVDPQILVYELEFDAQVEVPETADNNNSSLWIVIATIAIVTAAVASRKFVKR